MLKSLKNLLADNKQKRNQQGFTIVEVMIVLAIAGLILAVVFIAVPALQRNQRNGARANDRAFIQTQYDQASANFGGRVPDTIQLNAKELNYVGTGGGDAVNLVIYNRSHANVNNNDQIRADVVVGDNEIIYAPNIKMNGKKFTFADGNKEGSNQLIILAGKKCDSETTDTPKEVKPADLTASSIKKSLAIFYMQEGGEVVFCADDIN